MSFFPLDREILSSSIWAQDPKDFKVWIYLMLRADVRTGVVPDADPAIALHCGMSLEEVHEILESLAGPDVHSRTKLDEGRRIARTEEGRVRLLNYCEHRDKDHSSPRVRRFRERKKDGETVKRSATVTETTDTDTDKRSLDTQNPSVLETSETGNSRTREFHPRYSKKRTDLVWFNENDSISWNEDEPLALESQLRERFPARTRQIEGRGKTWFDELNGLSNWHADAPPSKKKRMTAQRWLFGRKFPNEERNAAHAARHRPLPLAVTSGRSGPKTFGQLKDEETSSRIERARERDQREEETPSLPTKESRKRLV